jgi:hypothetical protein
MEAGPSRLLCAGFVFARTSSLLPVSDPAAHHTQRTTAWTAVKRGQKKPKILNRSIYNKISYLKESHGSRNFAWLLAGGETGNYGMRFDHGFLPDLLPEKTLYFASACRFS